MITRTRARMAAFAARLSDLSKPPAIYILSAAIPTVFILLGLARGAPFVDDVTAETAAGDDWFEYKQNALMILQGDWVMRGREGNYLAPRGFLYNYFLAGVYAVIGDNSAYVYVVQAAMLGASVPLMYFAFRRHLSGAVGVAYLLALSLLLYVDVFLFYSRRLLGENLLIFLLPFVFAALLSAHDGRALGRYAVAGAIMGAGILTRANLVLVAPVAALLLYLDSRPPGLKAAVRVLVFIAAICVIVSFMAARNYAVTGEFSVASFSERGDWQTPRIEAGAGTSLEKLGGVVKTFIVHYTRRALYCVGFLFLQTESPYPVLPHWFLMWLGAIVFAVLAVRRRRLLFWESLLAAFVFFYLGPLIAVAPLTYGVRLIVPLDPALLLLGFRAIDIWTGGAGEASS